MGNRVGDVGRVRRAAGLRIRLCLVCRQWFASTRGDAAFCTNACHCRFRSRRAVFPVILEAWRSRIEGLAFRCFNRFVPVSRADLVAVGVGALFEAWIRLRPRGARRFDVYGKKRVHGAMIDAIRGRRVDAPDGLKAYLTPILWQMPVEVRGEESGRFEAGAIGGARCYVDLTRAETEMVGEAVGDWVVDVRAPVRLREVSVAESGDWVGHRAREYRDGCAVGSGDACSCGACCAARSETDRGDASYRAARERRLHSGSYRRHKYWWGSL